MIFYLRLSAPQLIDLYVMHQLKEKEVNVYVDDPENRSKIISRMEDVKNHILNSTPTDDER